MATTEIMPVATTVNAVVEATVVVGTPATVFLKGTVDNTACVYISLKDDLGNFLLVGSLLGRSPALVITAPGTYQFKRINGNCGVSRA